MWDEAIPGDQWGSPWCGAHGPPGERREVKGKGLLQVSFGYYHLKRDVAEDGMPRSGLEWWQCRNMTLQYSNNMPHDKKI